MKKILYIIPTIFLIPSLVLAHVKWFAEPEIFIEPYKITDPFVAYTIFFSILIILFGIFLEKKISVPNKVNAYIEKYAPGALSIASIGFGLAFIIFTVNGFVFAPNLKASGMLGNTMLAIQIVAGIMILLGVYERIGGFLIIILFVLGIYKYGALEMLDTLEMVGFAIYAMIIGRPKWKIVDINIFNKIRHHIYHYGYPILRVGTGLNLIILGFTEKILNPSLTNNFLKNYNWNFFQNLEIIQITNYHFSFLAGMVEVLFGVFFLLGLITRTTTVVLAIFLVTTLILLGPIELLGHLPHFSIAIALFVLGSGSRLILIKKNK